MQALADDTSEPVRIKATATTEANDAARTYAVAKQHGKTLGEPAERRPERCASDAVGPFLAQAGSADAHCRCLGTTFSVGEDSVQASPAASGGTPARRDRPGGWMRESALE
jgi:hypothetical protein